MKQNNIYIHMIAIFSMMLTCQATASTLTGSGSEADPYLIQNIADFDSFETDPNYWAAGVYTKMESDIDLIGKTYPKAVIISPNPWDGSGYEGVFDGNGHKIINLTINNTLGENGSALFDYLKLGAVVKNLGIVDCSITGNSETTAALVRYKEGTVDNCYSTGQINGKMYTGGLICINESGDITNSYSTCLIQGTEAFNFGGICANNFGLIKNCYTTGNIISDHDAGGVTGANYNSGSLENSYSTGQISGDRYVGGICGTNDGLIKNCYAKGDVINGLDCGGISGRNDASIENCYSIATIAGSGDLGGLCATNYDTIIGSFWDTEASGASWSDGGIGKTTAEMKQKSTFSSWDFIDAWGIEDDQTYPFLKLTYPTGDLDLDGGVNITDFAIFAENWLITI